jgi:hypothetical protein
MKCSPGPVAQESVFSLRRIKGEARRLSLALEFHPANADPIAALRDGKKFLERVLEIACPSLSANGEAILKAWPFPLTIAPFPLPKDEAQRSDPTGTRYDPTTRRER